MLSLYVVSKNVTDSTSPNCWNIRNRTSSSTLRFTSTVWNCTYKEITGIPSYELKLATPLPAASVVLALLSRSCLSDEPLIAETSLLSLVLRQLLSEELLFFLVEVVKRFHSLWIVNHGVIDDAIQGRWFVIDIANYHMDCLPLKHRSTKLVFGSHCINSPLEVNLMRLIIIIIVRAL